jgi:hypothetical protein
VDGLIREGGCALKGYMKWQAKGAVTAAKYQADRPGSAEPAMHRPRKDEYVDICLNCVKEKCRGGERCLEIQKAKAARAADSKEKK